MKEITAIRRALIEQGWRIESKGKGYDRAVPPVKDLPAVSLPKTPGEGRAIANLIAQLRRSGFIWPWNAGAKKSAKEAAKAAQPETEEKT
jgi:hypothetical protein